MLLSLVVGLLTACFPLGTAADAPPGQTPASGAVRTEPGPTDFAAAADYSARLSGRAVLVMRGGTVVYERYDNGWSAERPHMLASGTKSFTGVLAMAAVQDGLFTLDETVSDTITEWKSDPLKRLITVRHLLTLSSGLRPQEPSLVPARRRNDGAAGGGRAARDTFAAAVGAPMTGTPGGQFAYGPTHYFAFGEFLERKLRASDKPQKTYLEYLAARYFDAIGLSTGAFLLDPAGHPNLPGGCRLTARDWAKFGDFVLCEGAVRNKDDSRTPLIEPALLAECFKPSAKNPRYGLTWWLGAEGNPEEALAPDLPRRRRGGEPEEAARGDGRSVGPDGKPIVVHMAAGLGKQRLYVLPQWDMVIVRFAATSAQGREFDDRVFLRLVLGADRASDDPGATSKPKQP